MKEARPIEAAERQKIARIRRNSLALMLLWVLLWASVLGVSLRWGHQSRALLMEEKSLNQRLLQVKGKMGRALILKERLGKAAQIIGQRQDFAKPLKMFFASLPPGIHLNNVRVGAGKMEIGGSGDIMSISQLAQNYAEKHGDWFRRAVLTSLNKEQESLDFSFGLSIEF